MPYLIDGNNLLGSWGGPRGADDRRQEVLQRVLAVCRARRARATLVFDGGALRPELAVQDFGPVVVRVPPPGEDADAVIRQIVESAPRAAELTVVSSDKALYSYCKTLGAAVLRAHEWNALERRCLQAGQDLGEKPEAEPDVDGWLRRFGAGPPDDASQ